MVDVRGDVLRPPHGTTPAAVKSNKKTEMRSFKSNENIHKKEGGSYYVVSANKASSNQLKIIMGINLKHHFKGAESKASIFLMALNNSSLKFYQGKINPL